MTTVKLIVSVLLAAALASGCAGDSTGAADGADAAVAATASAKPATEATVAAEAESVVTAAPSVDASAVACVVVEPSITKLDKSWSEFSSDGNGAFVTVSLALRNECDRAIKAYAGVVEVFDTFGDSIFKGNWKETKKIQVGQTATSKGGQGYAFSEYEDPITALRDADRADLTVEFTPTKIVFANGTMVGE